MNQKLTADRQFFGVGYVRLDHCTHAELHRAVCKSLDRENLRVDAEVLHDQAQLLRSLQQLGYTHASFYGQHPSFLVKRFDTQPIIY